MCALTCSSNIQHSTMFIPHACPYASLRFAHQMLMFKFQIHGHKHPHKQSLISTCCILPECQRCNHFFSLHNNPSSFSCFTFCSCLNVCPVKENCLLSQHQQLHLRLWPTWIANNLLSRLTNLVLILISHQKHVLPPCLDPNQR